MPLACWERGPTTHPLGLEHQQAKMREYTHLKSSAIMRSL